MSKKSLILIYLYITSAYFLCVLTPAIGLFFTAFVPLMLLKTTIGERNYITHTLVFCVLLVSSGYVLFHYIGTIIFILFGFVPAIAIWYLHTVMYNDKIKINEVSPYPLLLAPLPALAGILSIYLLFPELVADFKTGLLLAFDELYANPDLASLKPNMDYVMRYKEVLVQGIVNYVPAAVYICIAFITFITEKSFYRLDEQCITKIPEFILALTVIFQITAILSPFSTQVIGINGLICLSVLYFARGIDVLRFNFIKYNVHFIVRVIFYFMLMTSMYIIVFVVFAGLVSVFKNMTKFKEG